MANTNVLEGFKCPKCKQEHAFKIACEVMMLVTDDGTELDEGAVEWDGESLCICPACGCCETVAYFTACTQKGGPR